jgi:hypothetical protein
VLVGIADGLYVVLWGLPEASIAVCHERDGGVVQDLGVPTIGCRDRRNLSAEIKV